MDTRYLGKDFLTKFIKIYESSPCLWNTKCKEYSNRHEKLKAFDLLINHCRTKFPHANRNFVVKKIQSIRGTHRKECKKVASGNKSSLWYFDLLSFLNKQENRCSETDDIIVIVNDDPYLSENDEDIADETIEYIDTDDPSTIEEYLESDSAEESEYEDIEIHKEMRHLDEAFVLHVLKLYKTYPCLWNHKHKDFNNKGIKRKSYGTISEECKKIFSYANRYFVVTKLQFMRGWFKKVYFKTAEESVPLNPQYPSGFWFFNLLKFLKADMEEPNSIRTTKVKIRSTEGMCESEDDSETGNEKLRRRMNKTLLVQFLEMYKSYPCLWQVNHKYYFNKTVKRKAYNALIELCKPTFPKADKQFVLRKFQNLRGVFRKENRMINLKAKSKTPYVPSIWYYQHFLFLNDENKDVTEKDDGNEEITEIDYENEEITEKENENQKETEEIEEDEDEFLYYEALDEEFDVNIENNQVFFNKESSEMHSSKQKENVATPAEISPGKPLPVSMKRNAPLNYYSEYDVVGISAAKKLQRMDRTQAVLAESLIHLVMKRGLLGYLSSTTIVNEE